MIRLLLAEDQEMMRSALGALLGLQTDLEVVAEVGAAPEILDAARNTQPEVALVDIELPGGDGLDATAQLRAALPACRVLIVTAFDRPGYLRRALEAGAAGFVVKASPSADLVDAIRRVAAGESVVAHDRVVAAASGMSRLSVREREVLNAAVDGSTVADIAGTLFLSAGTVRNYLSSAIGKTGARNRMEAIWIAQRRGWL